MPRKTQIEAAITAHNATDGPKQTLLPPEAARLLAVMFPRSSVWQGNSEDLVAKGFNRRVVTRLLRALVDAGLLSKDPGWPGVISTYRLHLPPVRR